MAVRSRPCERCGVEIPLERIETMPETRVCIKCSEEIGGEFVRKVRAINTAKPGSIKRNYSDYEVKLVRKRIMPKRS